jgi:hypothetical protein
MPTFGSVTNGQANATGTLTFGALASESANKPLFGAAAASQTTGFGSLAAQAQQQQTQPAFGGFAQTGTSGFGQQSGSLFSSFNNRKFDLILLSIDYYSYFF